MSSRKCQKLPYFFPETQVDFPEQFLTANLPWSLQSRIFYQTTPTKNLFVISSLASDKWWNKSLIWWAILTYQKIRIDSSSKLLASLLTTSCITTHFFSKLTNTWITIFKGFSRYQRHIEQKLAKVSKLKFFPKNQSNFQAKLSIGITPWRSQKNPHSASFQFFLVCLIALETS